MTPLVDEKRLKKLAENAEWGRFDRDELLTTLALTLKVMRAAQEVVPNMSTCATMEGARICHKSCFVCNLKEALAPFSQGEKEK